MRVGMGYDVHKLVEGRKLILGGVEIPYEKGLLGHSDADVMLHAVMDALLGAAALGDVDQINVKATTEEGLGFTGSGEGISSQAICAIEKFTNYSSVDVMEKPAGCGGCCAGR